MRTDKQKSTQVKSRETTRADSHSESELYRAVLYVEHQGCPNSDVTAAFPNVTVRSISGAFTQERRKKQLLRIEAGDGKLEEFVSAYRDHEKVAAVEYFPGPQDESEAYISATIEYSTMRSVSGILQELGAYRKPTATARAGSERWTLWLESHTLLTAVIDALESRGYPVTMREKREVDLHDGRDPWSTLSHSNLTDRQRETFLTAVELGYFESGGNETLEDVGEEMGLSTSATWEHLSKAKEKILTTAATQIR